MPNPKDSKWRSPSQALRKRKAVTLTLSDEARAKLVRLGPEYGGQSAVADAAILALPEDKK
jgi:hypothetical protein